MIGISDDLLSEIFLRLPLKSFIRFLTISRSWHAFVYRYNILGRFPMSTTGFFYRQRASSVYNMYYSIVRHGSAEASDPINPQMPIAASTNGLLLQKRFRCFYVCNPITGTGIDLPPSPHFKTYRHIAAGVIFDPRISCHYKVIEVAQNRHGHVEFQVFSSGIGKWVKSAARHDAGCSLKTPGDVVCTTRRLYVLLRHSARIVAVDLVGDEISTVGLPHLLDNLYPPWPFLCASEGSIRLFCSNWLQFSVWQKQINGDASWELKHCEGGRQCTGRLRVVDVKGDVVFMWVGETLLRYDMRQEHWDTFEAARHDFRWPLIPYSPCLVSPFGGKKIPHPPCLASPRRAKKRRAAEV